MSFLARHLHIASRSTGCVRARLEVARRTKTHIESFFHSLKADLIHGERFRDIRELRRHLRRYVRYYNYCRMHSALQYRAPVDYERGAA